MLYTRNRLPSHATRSAGRSRGTLTSSVWARKIRTSLMAPYIQPPCRALGANDLNGSTVAERFSRPNPNPNPNLPIASAAGVCLGLHI